MKLLLLSDLHLEFAPFTPDPQAIDEADVVVLAGDIDLGARAARWAADTFEGKPVIYIAGNHEFYGGHWEGTLHDLREACQIANIHFLENDPVTITGVRFLGCTLWTDFDYFQYRGRERRKGAMQAGQRGLNDFRLIEASPLKGTNPDAFARTVTPQHMLLRHQESVAWLRKELPKGDADKTVAVVHHCPRAESVAARWRDHPLTPCFASRLPDELLAQAALWVHGHTHDSFNYQIGPTRVVCNPRGYPRAGGASENPAFDPGLLVEVQP